MFWSAVIDHRCSTMMVSLMIDSAHSSSNANSLVNVLTMAYASVCWYVYKTRSLTSSIPRCSVASVAGLAHVSSIVKVVDTFSSWCEETCCVSTSNASSWVDAWTMACANYCWCVSTIGTIGSSTGHRSVSNAAVLTTGSSICTVVNALVCGLTHYFP